MMYICMYYNIYIYTIIIMYIYIYSHLYLMRNPLITAYSASSYSGGFMAPLSKLLSLGGLGQREHPKYGGFLK